MNYYPLFSDRSRNNGMRCMSLYILMIQSTWDTFIIAALFNNWGRHFPGDISKSIFLNEIVWISIKVSLKFVPKGPINNIRASVRRQVVVWNNVG